LSFDNGPEPSVTPRVLAVLAAHGAPATFFVIGEKLADSDRRRLAETGSCTGPRRPATSSSRTSRSPTRRSGAASASATSRRG
jgi:hypothetical protein